MSLDNFKDFIIDKLGRLWSLDKASNNYRLCENTVYPLIRELKLWTLEEVIDYGIYESVPRLEFNQLGYSPVAISEGRLYDIPNVKFLDVTYSDYVQVLYHGNGIYSIRRESGEVYLIALTDTGIVMGEEIFLTDVKLILGDATNNWDYPYFTNEGKWKWARINIASLEIEPHDIDQEIPECGEIIGFSRGILHTEKALLISNHGYSDESRDLVIVPVEGNKVIAASLYESRYTRGSRGALVMLHSDGIITVTHGKNYMIRMMDQMAEIHKQRRRTPWKDICNGLTLKRDQILLVDENQVLHGFQVDFDNKPVWKTYQLDERIFDRPTKQVKNARNKID